MTGIQESEDVVKLLKEAAVVLKKYKQGGLLSVIPELGTLMSAIKKASEDSDKIASELKDLTPEETSQLVNDLLVAAMALYEAVTLHEALLAQKA